jgi:hypothetical protein
VANAGLTGLRVKKSETLLLKMKELGSESLAQKGTRVERRAILFHFAPDRGGQELREKSVKE